MVVLMAFNKKDQWTFEELVAETGNHSPPEFPKSLPFTCRHSWKRVQPMFAFHGARESDAAYSQERSSKRRDPENRRHFRQRQLRFKTLQSQDSFRSKICKRSFFSTTVLSSVGRKWSRNEGDEDEGRWRSPPRDRSRDRANYEVEEELES